MNPNPAQTPNDSGRAYSETAIRRDMLRTITAVGGILGVLLILALVSVLAGLQATRNLHRAQQADATSRTNLADVFLTQARAIRIAGEPGRSQAALAAISNAAAISKSSELRTEAIASLALTDLKENARTIWVHPSAMYLAVDRDLKHFICADETGKIFVRETNSSAWFDLDIALPLSAIVVSPDAHWLAGISPNGRTTVWDLQTRQPVAGATFTARGAIAFTADSTRLVFSDGSDSNLISICELPGLRFTRSAVRTAAPLFSVSDDLHQVAINFGMDVDVRDMLAGTNQVVLHHDSVPVLLAWSPDGSQLAVGCVNGDVFLWDMVHGRHKVLTGHTARAIAMGFSADGRKFFTGSQDETTRLWDTTLGKTIVMGSGIAYGITPDGRHLGYWRAHPKESKFALWEVAPSPYYSLLTCDPTEGQLNTLDLSASGRWCAATQDKGIRVWDLRDGTRELYYPITNVLCARFAPDDQSLLLCRQSGLEIWPFATNSAGELALQPENARQFPLPDGTGARAIAVGANNWTAAVELTDLRMLTMDLSGRRQPVFIKDTWRNPALRGPGSPTGAGRFAISPDGKWLATGFSFGKDDQPKIYDTSTGEHVASLDANNSLVQFSPDGRWLGLAEMHSFSFWSAEDWHLHYRIDRNIPTVIVGALAFGPDATSATIGHTRQVLQICDFKTNADLVDFISPVPQSINAARLSLNGSVLVTATASDMVEVWRLDLLRRRLAELGLDWNTVTETTPVVAGPATIFTKEMLPFCAAVGALVLATLFALATLRRHRLALLRFMASETRSADRNRQLDAAKIELMHSQKMQALGTLAAGIAHDFNNLLSVIRMANKLVGRRATDDEEIQNHVADIEQAVVQGRGVVKSMLGYVRQRGEERESLDVGTVVEDVVSLLSTEFLRGITLNLQLDRDLPRVNAGRGAVEQILLNLVVNAAEAMNGQGKLEIIVRECALPSTVDFVLTPGIAESFVELSVQDSGPGIAPDLRRRIFEPFFTTKRTSSRPGTGLGLSLVYSVAQQNEAGLAVGNAPGGGAVFRLYFPVATAVVPVRESHSSQMTERR